MARKGEGKKAAAKLAIREERARVRRLGDKKRHLRTDLARVLVPVRAGCAGDWREEGRILSTLEQQARASALAPFQEQIRAARSVAPIAGALYVAETLAPIQRGLADRRMDARLAAAERCRTKLGTVAAPYLDQIAAVDHEVALFAKPSAKQPRGGRGSAKEQRQQDDAAIRRELEVNRPDLLALWDRIGKRIEGVNWHQRWERFLEVAAENPEDVIAAQSQLARQGVRQLMAEEDAYYRARGGSPPSSVVAPSSRRAEVFEGSLPPGALSFPAIGPGSAPGSRPPVSSRPMFALAPVSVPSPGTQRPRTQRGPHVSYEQAVRENLPNWQTPDPRQRSILELPSRPPSVPAPLVPPPRLTRGGFPGSPTSDQIGMFGPVQYRLDDLGRRAP